ncbi:hypothetical protein QVD99_008440 [Batrachochytrium dendrobatidis]|nr:hypothetical protein QVD99_008440 [Batrachochytrium dendrobatidis]
MQVTDANLLQPQHNTIVTDGVNDMVDSSSYILRQSFVNEPLHVQEPISHCRGLNLTFTIPLVLQLILWSCIGVLIRIGLLHMHTYDGAPVVPILYPQVVGCVIMGWISCNKQELASRFPNLLVGLSTGLCGSITTFSSFTLLTYQEFSGLGLTRRSPINNIIAGLALIGLTIGMSSISLATGLHVASLFPVLNLQALEPATKAKLDSLQSRLESCLGDIWIPLVLCLIVYISSVGVVIAGVSTTSIAFTLLFSPFGTLIRYILSQYNGLYSTFPIGTFLVNVVGSMILIGIYILKTISVSGSVPCAVLVGLADGFCGCLTTISTFAMELSLLPVRSSYIYCLASICMSQFLGMLIAGTWAWYSPVAALQPTCIA